MLELMIEERPISLGIIGVGRLLPFAKRRMVGPFVLFDHLRPIDLPPGIDRSVDVRPHPHIGLSTVTYLYSGEIMHRDSVGSAQTIRPHEVNWMTSGRGITHSERLRKSTGGRRPSARHTGLGRLARRGRGNCSVLFAPRRQRPAGVDRSWRLGPVDCRQRLRPNRRRADPLAVILRPSRNERRRHRRNPSGYSERAVYVASGAIEFRGERHVAGRMLVVDVQASRITAMERATVMMVGGEPIGKRFLYWNFVSSSKERLGQAAADWNAGRMKLPDADDQEFIPLPDNPPSPPRLVS